jgi:hypothetical protein
LFRLTRRGYYIFWEWFPLDFRQYLASMAEKAGTWFFTATARRLAEDMFVDLEIYVRELERAAREHSALQEIRPDRGTAT